MKRKIIFAIMFVICFTLIALSIYGYILKKRDISPFDVFSNAYDSVYKLLSDNINTDSTAVSGNVKLESNRINYVNYSNILNALSGNNINVDFGINFKDKTAYWESNSFYNTEKSINISEYYEDYYKYIYVEDYYETRVKKPTISTNYDNAFNMFNITSNEFDLLKELGKAIFKDENKEFFFSGISKEKILDKEYEVKANYISIYSELFNEYYNRVYNTLIENNTFLSKYKEVYGKDYDYKDYENLKDFFKKNTIRLGIYIDKKTNEFLKFEIFVQSKNEENTFSVNIIKNSSSYNVEIFAYKWVGTGSIDLEDKNITFKLSIPLENDTLNSTLKVSYDYVNETKSINISDNVYYFDLNNDKLNENYDILSNRREILNVYELYKLYKVGFTDNN